MVDPFYETFYEGRSNYMAYHLKFATDISALRARLIELYWQPFFIKLSEKFHN